MSDTKRDKKRIVLLDAHAVLHRAYHALPDFSSRQGEPTGALYGLSTMLLKIVDELEPDYIFACYDLPEPTHRHEMYEAYKAGRKKTDKALVAQIKRSRDLLDAFSVPWFEKEGYEADDLLGTLAEKFKQDDGLEVIIASGDYDTLQLVDDKRVQVYALRKGIKDAVLFDEQRVIEKFGFKPQYLADYKGLRGDASDNIPGIDGVGKVTATKAIKAYGSIEEIYEVLEEEVDAFEKEAGVNSRFINLLKEHKEEALFSKALATIHTDVPVECELPERRWQDSLDLEEVKKIFKTLNFSKLLQRVQDIYGEEGEGQETLFAEEDVDQDLLTKTAIALWLCDSTITDPGLEDILEYTGADSLEDAHHAIMAELEAKEMLDVYEEIEKPLISVVQRMNDRGVKIDIEYLESLSDEYHDKLSKIEKKICDLAGQKFNLNSPKQMREVLFEELELPQSNIKKTSTGKLSTAESELRKLEGKHPIIEEIFEHRKIQKLLSTYIDAILDVVADDGRLYATFVQAGTTTGRMTSTNPNLQNIPIRSKRGRRIRDAFVASDGFQLVALDYSQIELRIAAMLSQDEKLQAVFREGRDVHTAVAAEMFDVEEAAVTKNMRRKAKAINYGILYGMGIQALRKSFGEDTTMEEAEEFYERYFERYSGLAAFVEETKKEARKNGYTSTYFGRRRYFKRINSKIPYIQAQAERMAINAPIQGTQADVIKKAMVEVEDYLIKEGLGEEAYLLMQIHDELVYEIQEEKLEEVVPHIQRIMESIVSPEETGGVVFSAEPEVGPSLGELVTFTT